jgi:hypothetical protein
LGAALTSSDKNQGQNSRAEEKDAFWIHAARMLKTTPDGNCFF